MERVELKKRKRRLLTWILICGLLLYSGQATLVNVLAVPVTITLSYDATEGGSIVSNGYTESIEVESGATSAEDVILPTEVKKDGYVFKDWYIGVSSGYYDAEGKILSWDSSECESLEAGAPIVLTAQWRPENKINIEYKMSDDFSDAGQVSPDAVTQFRESQTAGPVTLTLPEVELFSERYIFSGWIDMTSGDIMQSGSTVIYEYPISETEDMGAEDTYTFMAQFDMAQYSEITFDADNASQSGVTTQTYYQKSIDEESTIIELPDAPEYANHAFLGWCEVDMSGDMPSYRDIYEAGEQIEIVFGEPKTFVAQWEWAIESGSVLLQKGTPYMFANENNGVTVTGDSTVYASGVTFYVKQEGNYTFSAIATQ